VSSLFDEMMEEICEKNQKIADLEAKLAESEKKAYSRGHSQRAIDNEIKVNALREDVSNKEKRIIELKQKLAEKEKQIEDYSAFFNQLFNQDKIEFAIAELEKVKELLLENLYDLYSKPSEIWDKYGDLYDVVVEGGINKTIDDQIKQLKEGK
jgi:predicted RNase H-like nuclease (RuvC/YqgF family)